MKFICLNVLIISMFIALLATTVQSQVLNNTVGNNLPVLKRGKRYLDFTKGSRMSWRTTVKNNILKVNTLWGYGFGFRANFPFPDKADRRRPFFKRDVFQSLTDVLDGHGLDGQACILKSYCTAHLDADSDIGNGMLFKLLKYLFTSGFDGKACILKAYCAAHLDDESKGMNKGILFKLLKHIFTLNDEDKRHFPYLHKENCHQLLHSHCPLSFNNISPFTDDV
ncbi:hypothetical protein DOY81_006256 [Sarcophaga bullata]|nr:hypothetical protein DOY81_006256 [Sarcophaga bullata]